MAYENIQITNKNFCIAPLVGTFGTINTINAETVLQFVNDSGGSMGSYELSEYYAHDLNIDSLEYIGPRNLSTLVTGLPFVSMLNNGDGSCTIKKWVLNTSVNTLNLVDTFIKSSNSTDKFECNSTAVVSHRVTLTSNISQGNSTFQVSSSAGMRVGDIVYLGPSSNVSYQNDFEFKVINNIIDDSITVSLPIESSYNSGDKITCIGDIYLFSDLGESGDTKTGTLFGINYVNGFISNRQYSGIFNNVIASTYGTPYHNTIAFVKQRELLYISVDNYEIQKSNRINNVKNTLYEHLDVFDLAMTSSTIYRLQDKIALRDDLGNIGVSSWSKYNFHKDSVVSYADSITVYISSNGIIRNQETLTLYVVVRDQYGVGLNGKTIHFDKVTGDSNGVWGDFDKEAVTDLNGLASITYTSGWYDPNIISNVNEDIKFTVNTDGSNIFTGSVYIWSKLNTFLNAKYRWKFENDFGVKLIIQKHDAAYNTTKCTQLEDFNSKFNIICKSKFQNPGGDWVDDHEPSRPNTITVLQVGSESHKGGLIQKDNEYLDIAGIKQIASINNDGRLSQTYVSRHLTSESNKDNVVISQYRFISELIPDAYSEKNNVNTNIWLKVLPYGYDLNKSTIVFKTREVSYAGDTDFIDYTNSLNLTVTEFDAGAGLLGLDILFQPPEVFHNDAQVYVYLEVYDNAIPSNKIYFDYWFKVIADYKAPYIVNEYPSRSSTNVPIESTIYFDILDNEVGVDINSLEFYINNRTKTVAYDEIENGYRITYNPSDDLYYDQDIEISVRVQDLSGSKNVLYDMWKYTCIGSDGPLIDSESITPGLCVRGVPGRQTSVSFNVYDIGTGIDKDSIRLLVDNKDVFIVEKPVIYRIK